MDIKFATAPDTPPSLEEVKEGSLQPEGRQIDTIESSIKTQSTMAAAEVGGTSAEQALQPPKPKVTEQVFNAAQVGACPITQKMHDAFKLEISVCQLSRIVYINVEELHGLSACHHLCMHD